MQLTALFAAFFLFLTGRIEATLPAVLQEAHQGTNLEAEKKELAAIRLTVAAERKFADAKERLLALDQKLSTSTHVDARPLRAEVAKLLTEVRRALGESTAADGKDKIDDAVRKAIREGDFAFVQQLGAAAATALAEAVRESPDTLPTDHGQDPFFYLLHADPAAASALCDELGDEGYFWKKRILRAFQTSQYFSGAAWTDVDGSTEPAHKGLVRQYELLFEEPDLRLEALNLLEQFIYRETLTPRLRTALVSGMAAEDLEVSSAAWRWVERSGKPAAIVSEFLNSPRASLRLRAARVVERYGGDPALLELSKEADGNLRMYAARQLKEMTWGERELDLLGDLLMDSEEQVVREAFDSWTRQPRSRRDVILAREDLTREDLQLAREVYPLLPRKEALEHLTTVQDESLRRDLGKHCASLPVPLAFELLLRLAEDGSLSVVAACIEALGTLSWEDVGATLQVVDRALDNDSVARSEVRSRVVTTVYRACRISHSGQAELWRWIARRGETAFLIPLTVGPSALEDLPPEVLPAICKLLFEADPLAIWEATNTPFKIWDGSSDKLQPKHLEALREVARDAEMPAGLRMLANRCIRPEGSADHAWVENLCSILADSFWRGVERKPIDWAHVIAGVLELGEPAQVNAVLLEMLRLPGLEPALLSFPFERLVGFDPSAASIVQTILERYYEDPGGKSLASVALSRMGSSAALADKTWLEKAVREGRLQSPALGAIGRLRDPSYLPLLDETLRASSDPGVIRGVVGALTGYLSNEAGELLLLAATKLSGEDRDAALAHLKKIREYQDARAEWATRKTSQQTRAAVVAELVAKLDAKAEEVKVEAIRALATWEAVEAMPRLIELTQSGSKSVAAAARAALERLNAPKETTGG